MPSFDIVSKVDLQELDNAVNQLLKEIRTRYDLKNSKCNVEFDKKEKITLLADDNMKLKAVQDILREKCSKRGIGVRSLDFKDPEQASGDMLRQEIQIKQGISADDGRKITKFIKELSLKKVQAQIQGDQVRVSGPKLDDLQAAISAVKGGIELELQFVNFKS